MTDHVHVGPAASAVQLVRSQLAPGWYRCDKLRRAAGYDGVLSEIGDCPVCLRAVIAALVCAIAGRGDGQGSHRIVESADHDPDVIAAGLTADDVFNGHASDSIADDARIAAAAASFNDCGDGGLTAAIFAYVRTVDAEAAAHKAGVLSGEWDGYGVPAGWSGAGR